MEATSNTLENGEFVGLFDDNFIIKFLCKPKPNHIVHMTCYFLLGLVGVVGNFLLLLVILCHRNLWKVVNSFIFNLSFANFLFIASIVPIQIEQEINPCWLANLFSCRIRYAAPVLFQSAGIFSLVALSRERYVAIIGGMHPKNKPTHSKLSLVIVGVIWVLAIFCALPLYLLPKKPVAYMCIPYKTFGGDIEKAHKIISLVFLYIIPLAIIAAHYIPVARLLLQSTSMKLSERRISNNSANNLARKRLAIIIMIITGTFAIMWFPDSIYLISYHFADSPESHNFPPHIIYYLQVINACSDPWVVFIMSSSYRCYLINLLTCSWIREKLKSHPPKPTTSINDTSANTISSRRFPSKTVTATAL